MAIVGSVIGFKEFRKFRTQADDLAKVIHHIDAFSDFFIANVSSCIFEPRVKYIFIGRGLQGRSPLCIDGKRTKKLTYSRPRPPCPRMVHPKIVKMVILNYFDEAAI